MDRQIDYNFFKKNQSQFYIKFDGLEGNLFFLVFFL